MKGDTYIEPLPEPLGQAQNLILHVRLKGIGLAQEIGYEATTTAIVESSRAAGCTAVLIPAYTYAFTKEKVFSVNESPSEVGRFSEEVRRLKGAAARTLDPVFSHIDLFDTFDDFKQDWNTEAFGIGSVFERWDQINGAVVNINLPDLIASQLHYIERRCRVPYRYDKIFEGRVEDCSRVPTDIEYTYYVRSLDENPQWDRKWIGQYLREQGVLGEAEWLGVPVRWFHAQAAREVLEEAIAESPRFLLGEV